MKPSILLVEAVNAWGRVRILDKFPALSPCSTFFLCEHVLE
jgi:hypothetical protein